MGSARRVVITGMGAVSSIGTGLSAVAEALRVGRSGIRHVEEWRRLGFGSQIAGMPEASPDSPLVTRKASKTASSSGLMALRATWEALETAGLDARQLQGTDLPVLLGAGTGSSAGTYYACQMVNKEVEKAAAAGVSDFVSTRRINPFTVPQVMGSTAAANVSVALGLHGESYGISSACSSGAHAIGLAALLIQAGRYDRAITGAADELDWTRACAFDAMQALSRGFNDNPQAASRPFDRHRDGFVISGGAGVLVLEELHAARQRGAPILAELLGHAATSDGFDMVAPLNDGAVLTMKRALHDAAIAAEDVDYVNAHGTSTPQGDPSEAAAMRTVFGERQPWISSTKSITGHAIGAAGSLEAIYCVLMMRQGFVAPSVNIDELDPACSHLRLARSERIDTPLRTVISNSFGFGGTNACLVLRRWDD